VFVIAIVAAFGGLVAPPGAGAQEPLVIKALTEKRVTQLPAGPLFWRVETFPTLAAAQAAAGPTALVAESTGRTWLFTLGPRGGSSPGGTNVAEVGPLPAVQATEYLLRINEASGAPGSVTTEHSHPGSEAFYVLAGELSLRTPAGTSRVPAGRTEVGPGGGTPLQVSSTGTTDLRALVMFMVDAAEPFSSPATLPPGQPHTPGMPHTGMGGAEPPTPPALVALLVGGVILVGVAGGMIARRTRRGH
jgi:quercetin dioxygenase-like cupin family protein